MRRYHFVLLALALVVAALAGDASADTIMWGTLGDDQIIWGN